ncbi:MAG: RNA polymerase sigma-70 factor [Odoribacter splanchnicus]
MAFIFDHIYYMKCFDLYYQGLVSFVYSLIKDEEVAKDIVNDIFLYIWDKKKELNPHKSVKSYLFTIARNCTLNYLKHQSVVKSYEQSLGLELNIGPEDWDNYEFKLEKVRKVFFSLPEKQQEVVRKCCIEGKKYKDVALELNISVSTVKTHLLRAMRFLRNELKQDFVFLFFLKN